MVISMMLRSSMPAFEKVYSAMKFWISVVLKRFGKFMTVTVIRGNSTAAVIRGRSTVTVIIGSSTSAVIKGSSTVLNCDHG